MIKHDHLLAFDKESVRSVDAQGFLHVAVSNISKAMVNDYLGAEIPDWQQLGLEPGKTYRVLRPPEELTKAAPTFNNLPLLDTHVEVGAVDLEDLKLKGHVVGSTGTDAEFKSPYLQNSLVIWTAGAIEGIQSKEKVELSCAYRYTYVPGAGTFEGQAYDGTMKDIQGNHVAIVEEGRAGHDVLVQDSVRPKRGLYGVRESSVTQDTIAKSPGHKNSAGQAAPVTIKSERTGQTLWSGKTKGEAKKALARMQMFKSMNARKPGGGG
jgi:hypothetical protein